MRSNKSTLQKSVSYLIALSVLSCCVSYRSLPSSTSQRCSLSFGRYPVEFNRAVSSNCGSITSSKKVEYNRVNFMTATDISSNSNDSGKGSNLKAESSKSPISKFLRSLTKPYFAVTKRAAAVKNFFDVQLPMFQYLWPKDNFRLRVFLLLSMVFMFLGKWFNVKVPFILQRAIDSASKSSGSNLGSTAGLFSTGTNGAAAAIIFYGVSRALSVICSEVKTCLFAHVSQNVLRKFANNIFSHLHSLDSEFHLQTPSGVISVAYVRAVRGFQTMLFQLVFSVLPTMLELALVSNILYKRCGSVFAGVTLATFSVYLLFTVWITQWRIDIRKELVDVDNKRNGFFIDSILNHEVVKLFTNEKRETVRFDGYLEKIQDLSIESTYAIAVLNLGQAAMFCVGLTTSLLIAAKRVAAGAMSVGDLVAVNSMLLQLSIPFNFMGFTCKSPSFLVLSCLVLSCLVLSCLVTNHITHSSHRMSRAHGGCLPSFTATMIFHLSSSTLFYPILNCYPLPSLIIKTTLITNTLIFNRPRIASIIR